MKAKLTHYRAQDGSKIRLAVFGSGPKKIFFVHGLMGDIFTLSPWAAIISSFNKEYTIYVPELRGHGNSQNKSFLHQEYFNKILPTDLETLANSVLGKDEKAVVVAYSAATVQCVNMFPIGLGKWVSKLVVIDHPLFVPATKGSGISKENQHQFPFYENAKEFYITTEKIQKYVEETPGAQNIRYNELPKSQSDFIRSGQEIVFRGGFGTGRLGFLKELLPLILPVLQFSVDTENNWMEFQATGYCYKTHGFDPGNSLKESGVDCVFFVGMKSGAFNPEWNIKTILERAPEGSKIVRFENSSHEPMVSEPIKFYKELSEAIKTK